MTLSVRVGDQHITRLADDLTLSWGLHGPASVGVRFRDKIIRPKFPAFENVWVYDHKASTQWEGRLEDPGRSVDGEGQAWDMAAVGESARAADRMARLIYADESFETWRRDDTVADVQAPSATTEQGSFPDTGTPCLFMQFQPGTPIDSNSQARMVYDAFVDSGMEVGAFRFVTKGGATSTLHKMEVIRPGVVFYTRDLNTLGLTTELYTPTDMSGAAGALLDTIAVRQRYTGTATNQSSDLAWSGFGSIRVLGRRVNRNGTPLTLSRATHVLPHEVVEDLVGRLLVSYDRAGASIDTSSTYAIDHLAYHDGATAEQVLADLMGLVPEYYWQVGPDRGSGPTFTWRKWPTHIRYEFSLGDGLSLPGNDAELFNRCLVRYRTAKAAIRTIERTSVVPALDEAGLVRTHFIDLGDDVGSSANAIKAGDEFLAEHATPPVAGTLTVARKVYDHDLGRMVEPYEIRPGHLGRIRELADSAGDLNAADRDGKSVFRVMGMEYRQSTRNAVVELDAPPKTDEATLAAVVNRRERKR